MGKVKGQSIEFKEVKEPRFTRVEADKAMWKAKHRKEVGRLISLRNLIKKYGVKEVEVRDEMRSLRVKLDMPVSAVISQDNAMAWIEERRGRKERAVKQADDAIRRERFQSWRERMQELKEVSKLVNNKSRTSTRLISGAEDGGQVCQQIRQSWQSE